MRAKKSTLLLTQAIQHTYGIRPAAVAPVIDWSAIRPRHDWFDYPAIGGDSLSILDLETDVLDSLRTGVGKKRVPVVVQVPDADGYYTFPIGQFGAPNPPGFRYAPGAFEKFAKDLPIVTPHHTIKSMRADKNGAVIGEVQFHSNPDNQRFMRTLINEPDDSAFSARYAQYMHNSIVDAHRDGISVDESFSVGIRGRMGTGGLLNDQTYNLLPRKLPTFSISYEETKPVFTDSALEWMRDAAGLPVRADLSNQYQREAAEFLVKEGKGNYAECLEFVKKSMYAQIPFVIRPITLDEVRPKGYHSREEKEFGGEKYWVYHMFPPQS